MVPILFWFFFATPPDLAAQMAGFAAHSGGNTGASTLVIESGKRASYHGRDRFPMQSVYKFPIAMAVLHAVDSGALALNSPVRIAEKELVPPALHSPIRDKFPDGTTMPLRDVLRYAV